MSSIFLSYADADESFASLIADDLEKQNHAVWKDRIDTIPQLSLLERIKSGPQRIKFIALLFSQSSTLGSVASSDWNDAITDEALHGRNWLIPLIIEDCELPSLIVKDSIEDFRDNLVYQSSFEKLIKRIS